MHVHAIIDVVGESFSKMWRSQDEGWLHSGDKGCVDTEGMFRITGRYKELIIGAGGEDVAVRRPKTTWTNLQHDGPNQIGLWWRSK